MAWRLRHEGSPNPIPVPLTSEQIVEGMKDGVYAITDEVKGPGDSKWLKLEKHPHFSEVAEVVEAIENEVIHDADDNNIDMNPLIDVCLVLLVFFILATTMSVMEKVMKLPNNPKNDSKPRVVSEEQAKKYIMFKVEKQGTGTIYKINEYVAKEEDIVRELERAMNEGKTECILDIGPGVDFAHYTLAVDKARLARIEKILTKAVNKGPGKAAPPAKAPSK
ncbi:MAG TPA: biopolymer transporter ExbD [Gemmatales bacterium]|nr:biopolymer transporter ExbD [Gemmatales bacterium]